MTKRSNSGFKTSSPKLPETMNTKFFDAIRDSNIEYLSHLENMSIDPKITNAVGDLAVHCAVRRGSVEVLAQLIRIQGKKIVREEDIWEESPLHIAIFDNKLEVVKFLVDNGADLQAADKRGVTPLLRAIKYVAVDSHDLERIIKSIGTGRDKAQKKRIEIVKFLLKNSTNEDIYPPHLESVVQSNHLDILEQMLKLGIDPDYQTSALMHAVMRRNFEAVKMLIAYGVTTEHNSHNCTSISNDVKIKVLIECADGVDALCSWLTPSLVNSSRLHKAIEPEKVRELLDTLDDSEKLALSNRAFYKLVGGKDMTAAEIHKAITEFMTIISALYNDNKINLTFLNNMLNEVLNNIEESGLFTPEGVPSLFSKALKALKKHGLWEQAITKNSEGMFPLPQNIMENEEDRKVIEHNLRECFLTARTNLIEDDVDTVNNLGGESGIDDYGIE